ncbi:MAG TPA: BamA/TamA family outer membrane protein, partial [bacterium]|nr:BamA/TamA family outer membrane protein [bacterium]
SPNVRPVVPPEAPQELEHGIQVTGDEGDIVRIGEDVHIAQGEVVPGDVVAVSADISVDGEVKGDVVTTSGDIELGPTAKVSGDVVAVFGDIKMADGAQVDGEVMTTDLSGKHVIIKEKGGKAEVTPPVNPEKQKEAEQQAKLAMTGQAVAYKISLFAPQAKDVRLTGSFINWDPKGIEMTRGDDGTWRTTYAFPPGTHLYKFIVDGKAIADPDVPEKQVSDGMGGYATQLVVASKAGWNTVPIRFSLARPDAKDVRVTGSFNDWNPEGIKMTKDEQGTWSVLVPIAPGYVTYKFYIDGEWGPDPDVAEKVDDGKGGFATPFTVKAPKAMFQLKGGVSAPERAGTNFSPAFDYNRVDGVYVAFILSNKTNVFPMPRFYLEGGHSWRRDRWLYSFELEQPLIPKFMLSIGGSFYDKTDTYDKEIISDGENVFVASFLKRDYRDYFDRRGVTGFATLRPLPHHMLKVYYASDEYRPLETKAHAAIFRHNADFPPNPHNGNQICYNPVSGITTCDLIELKSMGLNYEFDSRDSKGTPSSGIWARLGSEWAGRDFGGDLDFTRYTADLRTYNRVTDKQKVALRLAAGGLIIPANSHCGCVPGPEYFFPKLFYVGGIGTLPGYGFKEFQGTHMLLMNAEYVYFLSGGKGVLFFVDGGDARGQGESTQDVFDSMKIKFDAGVGFRIESAGSNALTLGVAKRLDDTDRDLVVTVRATRPF